MSATQTHSAIRIPEQQNRFAATNASYAYLTGLVETTNGFGAKRVGQGQGGCGDGLSGSRNERRSEKLAQRPGQPFPVTAAKAQLRAVHQLDDVVTVEQRL